MKMFRKLKVYPAFITQSYFAVLKDIRLNSTHYFIMKSPNKQEFQKLAFYNSSDIDFKDFMNLYKTCPAKPYSFLVTDAAHASHNPLSFGKDPLERT